MWRWWPAAFKAAAFLGCAAVSNCGRSLGFVSSEGRRVHEKGKEKDRVYIVYTYIYMCMCGSICIKGC